jgi:hypothetical protein
LDADGELEDWQGEYDLARDHGYDKIPLNELLQSNIENI